MIFGSNLQYVFWMPHLTPNLAIAVKKKFGKERSVVYRLGRIKITHDYFWVPDYHPALYDPTSVPTAIKWKSDTNLESTVERKGFKLLPPGWNRTVAPIPIGPTY